MGKLTVMSFVSLVVSLKQDLQHPPLLTQLKLRPLPDELPILAEPRIRTW